MHIVNILGNLQTEFHKKDIIYLSNIFYEYIHKYPEISGKCMRNFIFILEEICK